MQRSKALPLDYAVSDYAYVERPNAALLELLWRQLDEVSAPRILDIGCGAGANARAILERAPTARIVGVEPNPRAAELARAVCEGVFVGTAEQWAAEPGTEPFDAVLLSDVVEHVPNPVAFLETLSRAAPLRESLWIVSVPNYAVWYNRARTLLGRFDYAYSGLYDRTHLRFFTRKSIRQLLRYVGLQPIEDTCSASLVQSAAPVLRRFFEADVQAGDHLSLPSSPAYRAYSRYVEPVEARLCRLWPELLGFQIITAARLASDREAR